MLGMRNARDTALARLAKVEAERDEARSTLDAMSVSLRDRLAEAERERDGARAKLADVDRLLAIEEQAKRVARAERWHEWACLAYLDAHLSARTRTEDLRDALIALNEASDALDAERCKLAEMVGEGDET
jgi:chromosome segregation ATPase